MAVLALTGVLELWHMVVLVAVYGAGGAFFGPAFDAITPEVLPADELAQANALDQLVRPIALRLVGPAIGGVLIAVAGTGVAFTLDALSFLASAAAVLAMAKRPEARDPHRLLHRRPRHRHGLRPPPHVAVGDVRRRRGRLPAVHGPGRGAAARSSSRTTSAARAADLGVVFAAGGIGSVRHRGLMGQRGLPRRDITFMYVTWTLATLAIAGYGLASSVWQLMIASLLFNALETAGTIVWATAKQRHVPTALLGRVSSLDWLISIGLLPLSFALTGPVSDAIGVRATLVGAAVVGGVVTFAALLLPGMRAKEGAPPREHELVATIGRCTAARPAAAAVLLREDVVAGAGHAPAAARDVQRPPEHRGARAAARRRQRGERRPHVRPPVVGLRPAADAVPADAAGDERLPTEHRGGGGAARGRERGDVEPPVVPRVVDVVAVGGLAALAAADDVDDVRHRHGRGAAARDRGACALHPRGSAEVAGAQHPDAAAGQRDEQVLDDDGRRRGGRARQRRQRGPSVRAAES